MFKRQIHVQTEFKIDMDYHINYTGMYLSERASLCTFTRLGIALNTLILFLYSIFIIPETNVGS